MEQIITEIKTVKGSRKRQVYINDSLFCSLYRLELRELGLEEGMELTSELQTELTKLLVQRARRRALNLLVAKDRSKRELADKLLQDGYPEQVATDAVEFAEGYHYIDDLRYTMKQIRSMQEEKSQRYIRKKLQEKGIDRDIMEEAFEAVCEEREEEMGEEYEPAELTAIRKQVRRKVTQPDMLTPELAQKLAASLYQKGFEMNYIRQVLRQVEDME
ncbi:MAG: regulatory protein RecX [Lachnospiraceae bacterium]|nr:regulatory protein RecX [Lachnospiraceae bacterium]